MKEVFNHLKSDSLLFVLSLKKACAWGSFCYIYLLQPDMAVVQCDN